MKKLFLLLAAMCCLVINSWSTSYELYVAGIQVTDANKNAITGSGITGKVSFNSETKTLTLDNAKIEHTGSDLWSGAIKTKIALTINCIGENTIEGKGEYGNGIANDKDLTFEGTGKLSVKGSCTGIYNLYANSIITIANCEVTVEGLYGAISPYTENWYRLFVDKGTLLAKGNGTHATIYGCSSLTMTGVDFLTETVYYSSFYDLSTKLVSKADIKIGPKPSTYTITATATNGTVTGGGEYAPGETVTLTATPDEGYKFKEWSDGSTDNPYTFTATEDVTIEAIFVEEPKPSTYTITATATNGTVVGGGDYAPGATVTLGVIPNAGYEFTEWSDGSKDNPYTFTATKDVTLEATCSQKKITVTTSAVNGTVMGGGEYAPGATVTLGAIPNQGYEFSQWSDGNTDNPRTFTATKDVTLEAVFKEISDGIEEVHNVQCTMHDVRKVMRDGQLLIIREGEVFNAQGVKL